MKSQHPKDRLSTSRRNFIKAGVVTGGIIINLNWPSISAAQPKEGETSMLFHLDFHVEYSAEMTQNDLFAIWAEEAGAALGAKDFGLVVDLWKAVGERRVIVIVNVDSVEVLDRILLDLPIEPPQLNWSTAMFRKRRTKNGEQATKAGRDCLEVTAS